MISKVTDDFWDAYYKLPLHIQEAAKRAYAVFRENPHYPGLRFEQLKPANLFSVRVGLHYRALGHKEGDAIVWTWIGSHESYNNRLP